MKVPKNLTEDLKRCTLRVYSWNPRNLELCIALEDFEHMHVGVLCLDEVSHFCLPSGLEVESMEISSASELSDEFWCSVSVRKQDFPENSSFYVFDGKDGGRFFVAATKMVYKREE